MLALVEGALDGGAQVPVEEAHDVLRRLRLFMSPI
jgi:hypothetical protein